MTDTEKLAIIKELWDKYIPLPDINKEKDGKKEEKV